MEGCFEFFKKRMLKFKEKMAVEKMGITGVQDISWKERDWTVVGKIRGKTDFSSKEGQGGADSV